MMTRSPALFGALCGAAWLLGAAAPIRHTHHADRVRHAHRAISPPARQTAARPPAADAGTEPAPVPNEAVSDVPPGQAPDTRVTPSMLQLHYPNVGDGYVQGSSPQAMDDRNAAKAPGVEVQVPLQQ
jgi:hypothetical protein